MEEPALVASRVWCFHGLAKRPRITPRSPSRGSPSLRQVDRILRSVLQLVMVPRAVAQVARIHVAIPRINQVPVRNMGANITCCQREECVVETLKHVRFM